MPSAYILDVEADPNGGIWIGTAAGLVRCDEMNWMIYNQANTGMPGIVVFDVARRPSDGLIAIANTDGSTFPYHGGVSTFDGTNWTHYTPENSPLTHWQVVAVEFDGDGNLWASPYSEGVVQIMIDSTPTPTPTPSSTVTPSATPTATVTPMRHQQLLQVRHQRQPLPRRQGLNRHQECVPRHALERLQRPGRDATVGQLYRN